MIGVSGDAAKAEEFYEQAAKLGATEPDPLSLSSALPPAGRCDDSVCKLVNSVNGPVVTCERSDLKSVAAITPLRHPRRVPFGACLSPSEAPGSRA